MIAFSNWKWSICVRFLAVAIGSVVLGGCGGIGGIANFQNETLVAQAVSAKLTQVAFTTTPDFPILTVTPGDAAQSTSQPGTSRGPGDCNSMAAEIPLDITIPDQSILNPGERFIKTWRVKNTGSCNWLPDYQLIWFSGEDLNPSMPWYLGRVVMPGEVVDIGVEMVAPVSLGAFRSYYKLMDTKGVLFGLGPMGQAPLWVSIQVLDQTVPTETPLPTITLRPTTEVYHAGQINLQVMDQLDLDKGVINTGVGDDLALHVDEKNQLSLVPLGGVVIGYYGVAQPTETGCRLVDMQATAITPQYDGSGGYYCFQTGQGLPGYVQFTVDSIDNQVTVSYLTWAIP